MSNVSIDNISRQITPILAKHQVGFVGVFGSFARGEANEASDVDLLVRFNEPKSLLDVIGLEQELSEILGRQVEVVTERALHPYLKTQVMRDLTVIYGAR